MASFLLFSLKVSIVTAKVALRAVTGVDVSVLSDFMQEVKAELVEEPVERTLDEDALLRVASGGEGAAAEMQRDKRASYAAIAEFMTKEDARRRKKARTGDGYIDFRDSMERVHDGKGGLMWVHTDSVNSGRTRFRWLQLRRGCDYLLAKPCKSHHVGRRLSWFWYVLLSATAGRGAQIKLPNACGRWGGRGRMMVVDRARVLV